MYTNEQFAKMMDATNLKPTATQDDIDRLCEEAVDYHFASVCVFPHWVPVVKKALSGSDVKTCTVIGFPFGANTTAAKIYESKNAIAGGAKELDIVINISALKSGDTDFVKNEITELVETANISGMTSDTKGPITKFIIECFYLTDDEKKLVTDMICEAGGDFVKTSTGYAPGGATVEDIRLIRGVCGPNIGVKAAGGIRNAEQAVEMLNAGANRIGTSGAGAICDMYDPNDYTEGSRGA